jgi:uncharacterized protein YbcI
MSGTTTYDGQLSTAASISNHVVHLMSEFTGRGPTKAWTSIDDDLVSVVLRETLTKGERRLLAEGQGHLVLEMRRAFQTTMGRELISGVEKLTGRRVVAFLSANHLDPDIAIESFVMEPSALNGSAPPVVGASGG